MLTGSPTLFQVEGELLRCSKAMELGCTYHTKSKRAQDGDECPKCGKGVLAHATHQVDLRDFDGNGSCRCEDFEKTMAPVLRRMRTGERLKVRIRCRHLKAAFEAARTEENFTALLLTLPAQDQEEQP